MLMQYSETVTTDGSGNATVYVGSKIFGRIHAIYYAIGTITSSPVTITGETTGVPILTKTITANTWFYPKAAAAKVADGAASTISEADVYLFKERMKVVVASGTASKVGTITLYVDE